ncbi:hypothetical protein [Moraxella lacunata]|uniref:hypothetical protein n=1 Tax=Moraxella lacunata TaxID=477 RepID=UPI003EE07E6A
MTVIDRVCTIDGIGLMMVEHTPDVLWCVPSTCLVPYSHAPSSTLMTLVSFGIKL